MWYTGPMTRDPTPPHIGILREGSLHAALKAWLSEPGDLFEQKRGRYVIDIVRGDEFIEIQTRNFPAIRRKLTALTSEQKVRLIYPVAEARWILKLGPDGETVIERRRSPARGSPFNLFRELVSFPALIQRPTFSIEVLLTHEEEVRVNDGTGSWRRKGWRIADTRLLEVTARHRFDTVEDFAALLPDHLEQPFTTKELAQALGERPDLIGKMSYCLREMGVLEVVGKRGNAYLMAEIRSSS